MKNLYLFSFILLFTYTNSFAQKSFSLRLGLGTLTEVGGEFKQFTSSYNQVLSSQIDNNLSTRFLPFQYQFGAQYIFGEKFGMSLNYSTSYINYKASFTDNTARKISLIYSTPIDFGLIYKFTPKLLTEFRFGYATSSLSSSFIYADKTESYSNNKTLNGIYGSFGTFYRFDIQYEIIKNLNLTASVTLYRGGSEYSDHSYGKGLALDNYFMFPNDYKTYTEQMATGTIYDFPLDKTLHQKSTQLNVGLIYYLNIF